MEAINQPTVQQLAHPTIEIRKLEQFLLNIKVLKELQAHKPNPKLLKAYQGFGGLRQCFNSPQLYGMLMRELRRIFGRQQESEVFKSLRNSCTSAYYTPEPVITFMYRYLIEVCNFRGGDILEPACGNGGFFEHMPQKIKINSKITGIEFDKLTSKLVSNLYQEINIINQPLQNVDFKAKKYDLIIGNPPYSGELVEDALYPDISNRYSIHHYFVAKCIRLLKENGILAFVLPGFWMDIPRRHTRYIVNNEAVLVDAIRLPDNLFGQATVTVDIIFFRKSGKKIHDFTGTITLKHKGKQDQINQFWQANPNRVLGSMTLKWVDCYKRHVPTCSAIDLQATLKYLTSCKFSKQTISNFNYITSGG